MAADSHISLDLVAYVTHIRNHTSSEEIELRILPTGRLYQSHCPQQRGRCDCYVLRSRQYLILMSATAIREQTLEQTPGGLFRVFASAAPNYAVNSIPVCVNHTVKHVLFFGHSGEWCRIIRDSLDEELDASGEKSGQTLATKDNPPTPDRTAISDHWIASHLTPDQMSAVEQSLSTGSLILADEMGMGKTRTALASVLVDPDRLPCLIVCPASVRTVWRREYLLVGGDENTISLPGWSECSGTPDITVVSYNGIKTMVSQAGQFRSLIIDEAHSIKNKWKLHPAAVRKAKSLHRTEAVLAIAEKVPFVLPVTGTPILGKPRELFNLLVAIKHPLGNKWVSFATRYCEGKTTQFGFKADGAAHLGELADRLRTHIIRRTKQALNLPPKIRSWNKIDLNEEERSEYSVAWGEYLKLVLLTKGRRKMERVERARQVTKLQVLRKMVSSFKARHAVERVNQHDQPVIVFTAFTNSIEVLRAGCPDHVVYHGGMTEKQKAKAYSDFQSPDGPRVFIGQIDAAKVGLTLTRACQCIFVDYIYTPGDLWQAEDRLHRRGQTKETQVIYLHARHTMDDHIVTLLKKKREVIDSFRTRSPKEDDDALSEALRQELIAAAH